MIQSSIQITLSATGENPYVMKYPETVELKLDLSRSAKFWGVFLSIVETFAAIKEDRLYLLDAWESWRAQGFTDAYQIGIEVAVLENGVYNPIYTGLAIADNFTDDTYRIKAKFNQNDLIEKFLEGALIVEAESTPDRVFISNTAYTIMMGSNLINTQKRLEFNGVDFTTGERDTREAGQGAETIRYDTKNIANTTDTIIMPFITTLTNSLDNQSLFLEGVNFIVPKNSRLVLKPIATSMAAVYKSGDPAYIDENEIHETFKIYIEIIANGDNSAIIGSGELSLTKGSNRAFFITAGEFTIENNSGEDVSHVEVVSRLGSEGLNFPNLTAFTGIGGARSSILFEYTISSINNQGFTLIKSPQEGIIKDGVSLGNGRLLSMYRAHSLYRRDGYTSTPWVTNVNLTDYMESIKNALSIGVTVDTDDNQLIAKHITEFFEDEQSVYIDSSNVFALEVSLNSAMLVNKLVVGAQDNNFKYPSSNFDHNRTVTYTARNVFSQTLDLTQKVYKCQSMHFVDMARDEIFKVDSDDFLSSDKTPNLLSNVAIPFKDHNTYYQINNGLSPHQMLSSWSWLLRIASPTGYDLVNNDNVDSLGYDAYPIITNDPLGGTGNIESSDPRLLEVEPVITTRKIQATIKLTTLQYNEIVNNRGYYITLNYRGVNYQGYINNLSLDLGKNMLAEVELLERYTS